MLTRDHTILPAIHPFIHIWNEPSCLYFPAAEHHCIVWCYLYFFNVYTTFLLSPIQSVSAIS